MIRWRRDRFNILILISRQRLRTPQLTEKLNFNTFY